MNKVNFEKMLDVIFDGVTEESFKKRYYGRSFNNEYIRRSNILNGFTCVNVPNEMYMDITIQRCTVVKDDDPNDTTPMTVHINFYKQTIPERYVINKLYDTEFSLKRWFEGCYTTTKRTYKYTVNNETDDIFVTLNKVIGRVEHSFSMFDNILNDGDVTNYTSQMTDLDKEIAALNEKLSELHYRKSEVNNKMQQAIKLKIDVMEDF